MRLLFLLTTLITLSFAATTQSTKDSSLSERKKVLEIVREQIRFSDAKQSEKQLYEKLEEALSNLQNAFSSLSDSSDLRTDYLKEEVSSLVNKTHKMLHNNLRGKSIELEKILFRIQRLRDATWYIKGHTVTLRDNIPLAELSLGELADLKQEMTKNDEDEAYARKVARKPLLYGITKVEQQEMIMRLMMELRNYKTDGGLTSSDSDSIEDLTLKSTLWMWPDSEDEEESPSSKKKDSKFDWSLSDSEGLPSDKDSMVLSDDSSSESEDASGVERVWKQLYKDAVKSKSN